MVIKYKNEQGNNITEQQIPYVKRYLKEYYIDSNLVKQEKFSNGELKGLIFYNSGNENHLTIINNNLNDHKWIYIIEYSMYSGYKLEKTFCYNSDGIFIGTDLGLFDLEGNLIAKGYKNENNVYEYDTIEKYYWDRTVNPERELFDINYKENNGDFDELYWNNYHIDDDGQESISLGNDATDRATLISMTGMSPDLVDYYMSHDIIPFSF